MEAKPFGWWTWDNHKNGLAGVPGDPDNPAVVHEDYIVYSLKTSKVAVAQFERQFPHLLPDEQARLLDILRRHPTARKLFRDLQIFNDQITRQSAREGIRVSSGPTGAKQKSGPAQKSSGSR